MLGVHVWFNRWPNANNDRARQWDKNINMYILVSIFDRCTCMFQSFSHFFCCFHTTIDYLSQIYRDTLHFTLYNGTVPVYPQQRTGACKCHVIAAVLRLRLQKLTPAELQPFCHVKWEHYNYNIICCIWHFQMIRHIYIYVGIILQTFLILWVVCLYRVKITQKCNGPHQSEIIVALTWLSWYVIQFMQ